MYIARLWRQTAALKQRNAVFPAVTGTMRFMKSFALANDLESRLLAQRKLIEEYGSQATEKTSIDELLQQGQDISEERMIASAQFLRKEIAVRIAKRVLEFHKLPYIVGCNPHFMTVFQVYNSSFEKMLSCPPIETAEDEQQFCKIIEGFVSDHEDVVGTLAKGVQECLRYMSAAKLDSFIDTTLRNRLGIRILLENHLALHRNAENFIGIVCRNVCPAEVVRKGAIIASQMTEQKYMVAPQVVIDGDVEATFPYVPFHVEYCVLELLKNAMRATAENNDLETMPNIQVTIGKAPEGVTIRISDQGGGISPENLRRVFNYTFTTVKEDDGAQNHSDNALGGFISTASQANSRYGTLAGLGFGVPMTRVFAEFFGGSLHVETLYGYGTDVYLRLQHIGTSNKATV
eukprot:Clim_evm20s51 gene=Clim_evmTU20s51